VAQEITRSEPISRREFTVESVLALLAGVVVTISGCDDSDSPTSPSGGAAGDFTGNVSANHGHVATVTAAQITAATAVTLNIQGSATHPHTVTLTADQVRSIGARTQVSVTSTTNDDHIHTVTFN
jgi:hypothetical protein